MMLEGIRSIKRKYIRKFQRVKAKKHFHFRYVGLILCVIFFYLIYLKALLFCSQVKETDEVVEIFFNNLELESFFENYTKNFQTPSGGHKIIESYIKNMTSNEDSYEHVNTACLLLPDNTVEVKTWVRIPDHSGFKKLKGYYAIVDLEGTIFRFEDLKE
jgi:hypothetical protein